MRASFPVPLRQVLTRFGQRCDGNVAVIFGIALIPTVGLMGAAIDYTRATNVKAAMQASLDAAVLAGATVTTGRDTVAQNHFNASMAPKGSTVAVPTFTFDPASGAYSGSVSATVNTALLGVMNIKSVNVKVAATASISPGVPSCVVALDPSVSDAVRFSDGAVTTDCTISANSTNAKAITVINSAAIDVGGIYTAGGYDGSQSSVRPKVRTAPRTYQTQIPDPFASLSVGAVGGCTYSNMVYSDATATLLPGVYCNGIKIINTSTITLQAGVYYINGGNLEIRDQATVKCGNCGGANGITFVLTSTGAPSNIGTVIIEGSANVTLAAPTGSSSPFNGILFFQDRRATAGGATFTSGTNIKLSGVLYFPSSAITLNGNTTMTSPCLTIVGKTVVFASGASVKVQGCTVKDYRPYNPTTVISLMR